MFGRNLQDGQCGLSFFEQILMSPKASEVMKLIWEKFGLYQTEELVLQEFELYQTEEFLIAVSYQS